MAQMIKYKGTLYQRVDSKNGFENEAEMLNNELSSIILKAKAAISHTNALSNAKTSQEVAKAINEISVSVETIQGWSCDRILARLKEARLKNNSRS